MKKLNYVLSMLLLAAATLSSCLGSSDSETTLYDDAVITSFTLGTLNQYKPGTDSVLAKITGSNYPMSIDHLTGRIFNRTPLPVGTRVNSVECTVSTLNNGAVALQDTTAKGLFEWFDPSVAVDFTAADNTRHFRVYASDGSFYRDYDVTLNVAATAGNSLSWGAAVCDTTLLQGFADMRLVTVRNKRLVALCADGTNTVARFSDDNGATWQKSDTETLWADSAWASAVVKDSTLYMLSDGQLCQTDDGEQWNTATAAEGLSRLVAASKGELFALFSDSTLRGSTDNGAGWTVQTIDETLTADSAKHLLAMSGTASVSFDYPASHHADYVLLVGNDGNRSIVWSKLSHYDPVRPADQWVCIPAETINHRQLPVQQRLSLVCLDGSILAFGDDVTVYASADQGITWQANGSYQLPEPMLAVTTDAYGRLCAISKSGKVYRAVKY